MNGAPPLSPNVLRDGREGSAPQHWTLRAGPLTAIFEAGDLRYVRLGDREIARRIYVAVRDHTWGTVIPRLSFLRLRREADSFQIELEAEHQEGDIDFVWRGTLSGDAHGTIRFAMDGEARSSFQRNRIGICVLHPPREVAGAPLWVEQDDGSIEEGAFPAEISPHQPALEIRALFHEVLPGLRAEFRFDGDIFEMEDQRNWTDASFKTYSTPLRIPIPVQVQAGTKIAQRVTLSLAGELPRPHAAPEGINFSVGDAPSGPLPRLGLGVASHGQPLSERELERLRALHLAHLRVDLELSGEAWPQALRQASEQAAALGASLEIALLLTAGHEAEQVQALRAAIDELKPSVSAWLVLHRDEHVTQATSAQWVALAREHLGSYYDPQAKLGAGTNANFTELNREHPAIEGADVVFYPINPQVHAFDNRSMVETLEGQAWTTRTARGFSGDIPLAVTPVTLKRRFSPRPAAVDGPPAVGELPEAVDARQTSLFGAAWTLGSLKYLAESGVWSTTYYETSGWRGVQETEAGSSAPARFRSIAGGVFPLYHVLADVGEFAAGEVIPSRSSDTLAVDGLTLRKDGATRVLLANLTPQTQRVLVGSLAAWVTLRRLDETNAEAAMRTPEEFRGQSGESLATRDGQIELELAPYAVARIDTAAEAPE